MTRRALAFAAALALAALAALVTSAASCTTFDGVELPSIPDATMSSTRDAPPPRDAAPEASGPHILSYLSTADAARACSLIFTCPELAESIIESLGVPVDNLDYAACMDWLSGPLPATRVGIPVQSQALQCIAEAATCTAAGSCLALEELAPNDPRCIPDGGPTDASIPEECTDDGGTVLRCGQAYALHCTSSYYAPGSTCLKGQDGTHWCATSTNCTATTNCVGSLLTYCGSSDNLTQSINCAATGYTCGIDVEAGAPDCLTRTTDVACPAPGSDCEPDSSVLSVCDGDELGEFDCAALDGGTCTKAGSGTARCARPGDQCNTFDANENLCTGTSISLCIGGEKASFDCATIGMTCKPTAGALSGHCG